MVAGLETDAVLDGIREMEGKEGDWRNPLRTVPPQRKSSKFLLLISDRSQNKG
jgi:hypothetical protein